jgi:hypothetical protein
VLGFRLHRYSQCNLMHSGKHFAACLSLTAFVSLSVHDAQEEEEEEEAEAEAEAAGRGAPVPGGMLRRGIAGHLHSFYSYMRSLLLLH